MKFTSGMIQAQPPRDISINLEKLKLYTNKTQPDQRKFLIRLVLAHEFAHLLQEDTTLSYSFGELYRIRIREAQADILAARYAVLKYYEENANTSINLLDEKYEEKKFTDAYRFFFNIGYSTNSLLDHPTRYQRASCIYRGVKCARIEILKTQLQKLSKEDSINSKALLNLIEKEQRLLNIKENLDPFIWSWEQASLICHGNPTYLANFAAISFHVDTIESKDKNIKIWTLYQAFVNEGNEALDVNMESRIAAFRNSSTPFFDNIEFTQANYRQFRIEPNELRQFRDTFITANDSKRYEVILPPDSNALYTISPSIKRDPKVQKQLDNMALDSTIQNTNFEEYILKLNNAIKLQNISSIITSAGGPSNDGYDIYSLRYIGIVPNNETFTSTVSYDGRLPGQYMINLNILETDDSIQANKMFDYYVKRLSSFLKIEHNTPKDWAIVRAIDTDFQIKSFKLRGFQDNINYLYLKKFPFNFQVHPFNIINGNDDTNKDKKAFYRVYLTIRQPQNLSQIRDFPTRFPVPANTAN